MPRCRQPRSGDGPAAQAGVRRDRDEPAAQYGSSPDSPLEQAGFEPTVPRWFRGWPGRPRNDLDQREGEPLPFRGGPTVRIRFPPAESPRTIGSAGDFTGSMSGRSHLFRRIVQGRDAGGMIATRCLAAILAADVAGYSRLIGATTGIIAAIAEPRRWPKGRPRSSAWSIATSTCRPPTQNAG